MYINENDFGGFEDIMGDSFYVEVLRKMSDGEYELVFTNDEDDTR